MRSQNQTFPAGSGGVPTDGSFFLLLYILSHPSSQGQTQAKEGRPCPVEEARLYAVKRFQKQGTRQREPCLVHPPRLFWQNTCGDRRERTCGDPPPLSLRSLIFNTICSKPPPPPTTYHSPVCTSSYHSWNIAMADCSHGTHTLKAPQHGWCKEQNACIMGLPRFTVTPPL